MKLTRRDVSVLLYLVAILSIFLTYQFYYSTTITTAESVLTECSTLQAQVDELKAKVEQQPQYEAEIEEMEEEIADILELYPSSISEEDIILYVKELNDELDMGVTSVSFSTAVPVYTVVGSGHAEEYNFNAESISVTINYTTDYDGMKNIVNYINDDPDHRVINSMSISIGTVETDEDEETTGTTTMAENSTDEITELSEMSISGTLSLVLYLIDGKPVELEDTESRYEIPEIEHGVDEIFSID